MKIRNEKLKKELDEIKDSIGIDLDNYEGLEDLCYEEKCRKSCPFKNLAFREDLTCNEAFVYKKYDHLFENEGIIRSILSSKEPIDTNEYCLKTYCKDCVLTDISGCICFIGLVEKLDYDLEEKMLSEDSMSLEEKVDKILKMLDKLVK